MNRANDHEQDDDADKRAESREHCGRPDQASAQVVGEAGVGVDGEHPGIKRVDQANDEIAGNDLSLERHDVFLVDRR